MLGYIFEIVRDGANPAPLHLEGTFLLPVSVSAFVDKKTSNSISSNEQIKNTVTCFGSLRFLYIDLRRNPIVVHMHNTPKQ